MDFSTFPVAGIPLVCFLGEPDCVAPGVNNQSLNVSSGPICNPARRAWKNKREWADPMITVPCLMLLTGVGLAQLPAIDPVKELHQALITPASEPDLRQRNLAEAAGRVRSLPDLGRALMLMEWRDGDLDPQVAGIDRALREALITRFQKAVRDIFERGSPPNQVAAADLVGQVATSGPNIPLGRSLAPDLARLAAQGHPTVREAAVRALGRVVAEPAVALPVLRDMQTTGTTSMRQAVADAVFNRIHVTALRTAPGKGATPKDMVKVSCAYLPLAGVGMQDSELAIRRTCLSALGDAVVAVIPLTYLKVERAEPGLKGSAVALVPLTEIMPLLSAIRSQGPALARVLGDPDPTIRLMAGQRIEEIARLHSRLISEGLAADNPLRAMWPVILPPLARGLSDPDYRLRRATLAVLESLGPDAAPAAEAIYDALDDTDRLVRWGAARLVGKIGATTAPTAVPALARLLYDSDLDLRLVAATTLGQYGPVAAPAVTRLGEMAAGPEALTVRLAALRALAAIGKGNAGSIVPILLKALADPDVPIRLLAVQSPRRDRPGRSFSRPCNSETPRRSFSRGSPGSEPGTSPHFCQGRKTEIIHHKDTKGTNKVRNERQIRGKVGEQYSSFLGISLCTLCLCGE